MARIETLDARLTKERLNTIYHSFESACCHPRVERQRQDLRAHLIGNCQVTSPTVLEQGEPVSRLPMDAAVYASFTQMAAQRVAPLIEHSDEVHEGSNIMEICVW